MGTKHENEDDGSMNSLEQKRIEMLHRRDEILANIAQEVPL